MNQLQKIELKYKESNQTPNIHISDLAFSQSLNIYKAVKNFPIGDISNNVAT